MSALLTELRSPHLPSPDARWQEWLDYGLLWASMVERHPMVEPASPIVAGAPARRADEASRILTLHAYRETTPGPRWQALYAATWPAYRRWYTREGLAARPSLGECRRALVQHLPELVPTWERLCRLTGDDPVAARMLSMWGPPAFAVGCSQVLIPGEQPTLIRNYDYDQALFEGVIASTNYSGHRRVLGTSDMLWGLLDGMNEDGLAISLTFGGRPGGGEGFGIPIVMRYLLETCATVEQGVSALRRIPVAQSYNVAMVDTTGSHATVFVAPEQPAVVSRLEATTNHRLSRVEHPATAARFNSVGRLTRLEQLRGDDASGERLVAAMLQPPLRNNQFDVGFGTLYTAKYEPAAATATWYWPETSWTRRFDDRDAVRTVDLATRPGS